MSSNIPYVPSVVAHSTLTTPNAALTAEDPAEEPSVILEILHDPVVQEWLTKYYRLTHTPEYADNPCAANTMPWPVAAGKYTEEALDRELVRSITNWTSVILYMRDHQQTQGDQELCHHRATERKGRPERMAEELLRWFKSEMEPDRIKSSIFQDLLSLRVANRPGSPCSVQ